MKNLSKVKLNVILKKSIPMTPQGIKSSISSLESSFRMTRLFNPDELVRDEAGLAPLGEMAERKEKLLETAFNKMNESEKKLYRIWQVELEPGDDVDEAIEKLRQDSNVESVEINELNELYYKPNDPRYGELYGLNKIQCECAWESSVGEDVVVAVIDTGVDYNHPDIRENMWTSGNGHYGRDFSDNDGNPMDYHGHGSHVAGTIAAVGNNGTGIIGVAPKVKIMALKIFPNAYDDVAALALKYAVDNGAKIINNSWGPSRRRPNAPIIEAAIDYVHAKGGICIFAAGNSNDQTKYYSPANYSKTISVGATDQNDKRAGFSNYGDKTDIAAPGKDILSLLFASRNYIEKDGTSMASPHVAGACALLLSKSPSLKYEEVKKKLISSSDSISTDHVIGGRLNVCNLLK